MFAPDAIGDAGGGDGEEDTHPDTNKSNAAAAIDFMTIPSPIDVNIAEQLCACKGSIVAAPVRKVSPCKIAPPDGSSLDQFSGRTNTWSRPWRNWPVGSLRPSMSPGSPPPHMQPRRLQAQSSFGEFAASRTSSGCAPQRPRQHSTATRAAMQGTKRLSGCG